MTLQFAFTLLLLLSASSLSWAQMESRVDTLSSDTTVSVREASGDSVVVSGDVSDSALSERSGDPDVLIGAPSSLSSDSVLRSPSSVLDARPDPFDWLLNLPSDWYNWTTTNVTLDNIPIIGGIAVMTAQLVVTDDQTYEPFREEYLKEGWFKTASDIAVFTGDGKFQFGLASLFVGFGLIADDDRAVRTGSQVAEVILACGGVVQVLKHLTGRESPFVRTSPTGVWRLFPSPIEYHKHVPHYDAYPSGHVATLTATLTVIAENYPEEKWIPWVGYPVVGALAIGMVGEGIHWWSDYPLALALGITFGKIVAHPEEFAKPAQSSGPKVGMTIMPDGNLGLNLSMRF